jgi:hypothetical protein
MTKDNRVSEKEKELVKVNSKKLVSISDFQVYDCARVMKLIDSNFMDKQLQGHQSTDW